MRWSDSKLERSKKTFKLISYLDKPLSAVELIERLYNVSYNDISFRLKRSYMNAIHKQISRSRKLLSENFSGDWLFYDKKTAKYRLMK